MDSTTAFRSHSWSLHLAPGFQTPLSFSPNSLKFMLDLQTTHLPAVSFLLYLYLFFLSKEHHPQINASIDLFCCHLKHIGMIKATTNSCPSCRGAKAPPPNLCLWSLHLPQRLFQNSPLCLPPIQYLPHILSLKGDWCLQHRNQGCQVELPEPPSSAILHPCVTALISRYSLLRPLWSGHPRLSVPCTRQAHFHLRAFAPAIHSAWNAPPSDLHMLAPCWHSDNCLNVSSVRFSQTNLCKVVSQALRQFTQNSLHSS